MSTEGLDINYDDISSLVIDWDHIAAGSDGGGMRAPQDTYNANATWPRQMRPPAQGGAQGYPAQGGMGHNDQSHPGYGGGHPGYANSSRGPAGGAPHGGLAGAPMGSSGPITPLASSVDRMQLQHKAQLLEDALGHDSAEELARLLDWDALAGEEDLHDGGVGARGQQELPHLDEGEPFRGPAFAPYREPSHAYSATTASTSESPSNRPPPIHAALSAGPKLEHGDDGGAFAGGTWPKAIGRAFSANAGTGDDGRLPSLNELSNCLEQNGITSEAGLFDMYGDDHASFNAPVSKKRMVQSLGAAISHRIHHVRHPPNRRPTINAHSFVDPNLEGPHPDGPMHGQWTVHHAARAQGRPMGEGQQHQCYVQQPPLSYQQVPPQASMHPGAGGTWPRRLAPPMVGHPGDMRDFAGQGHYPSPADPMAHMDQHGTRTLPRGSMKRPHDLSMHAGAGVPCGTASDTSAPFSPEGVQQQPPPDPRAEKNLWSPEEDAIIAEGVQQYGFRWCAPRSAPTRRRSPRRTPRLRPQTPRWGRCCSSWRSVHLAAQAPNRGRLAQPQPRRRAEPLAPPQPGEPQERRPGHAGSEHGFPAAPGFQGHVPSRRVAHGWAADASERRRGAGLPRARVPALHEPASPPGGAPCPGPPGRRSRHGLFQRYGARRSAAASHDERR